MPLSKETRTCLIKLCFHDLGGSVAWLLEVVLRNLLPFGICSISPFLRRVHNLQQSAGNILRSRSIVLMASDVLSYTDISPELSSHPNAPTMSACVPSNLGMHNPRCFL
ncbi:hypothetical protein AVEN_82743-1 [Araneus ventricosus]|uniref:Uncharacterized protein n=1 Tax=Araneus ventricosus TaxID=182803 RepID=A0A4Y2ECQ6_ARAVE|nr:hypothetical protein AVEN_82743-1 [Araneus ventricosus]